MYWLKSVDLRSSKNKKPKEDSNMMAKTMMAMIKVTMGLIPTQAVMVMSINN
jgi:hypothetical protein